MIRTPRACFFGIVQQESARSGEYLLETAASAFDRREMVSFHPAWEGCAVENTSSPLLVVTRIGMLGLLGFAVIVLAGPVIGIVGALLPFVLVGFLAWCLFQLVSSGPQATWRTLRQAGGVVGTATVKTAQFCNRAVAFPARTTVRVLQGTKQLAGKAWRGLTASAKIGVEGGIVTLSGAAVGALVGLITSWQSHEGYDVAIPPDAMLGGLMAAGVWVAMTVIARKRVPVVEAVADLPPQLAQRA
jgi:hypothetical protein